MKTKIAVRKATARIQTGATILMNAQAVNTKPVRARFAAFAVAHRDYCGAQTKVDEAENALVAQQALVAQLDATQDDAVHTLAVSLINSGQPLTNAFAGYSDCGPGTIKAMAPEDAVGAIYALVTALRRSKSLSPDTLNAAKAAEHAAQQVEAALPSLSAAADALRGRRALRDTYAQTWDAELASLRLAARSAEREVPGLSAALFGRTNRSAKKANTAARMPAHQDPPASAAPAPAETTRAPAA